MGSVSKLLSGVKVQTGHYFIHNFTSEIFNGVWIVVGDGTMGSGGWWGMGQRDYGSYGAGVLIQRR